MAIYYISSVDELASDSNNGLTEDTAWQTVDKITSGSFSPGDRIKIDRAGNYGHFTVPNSGSEGNKITIESYGAGADPRCYASIPATGWNDEGGNIHSFQHASMTQNPKSVTFDGALKPKGKSQYFVITAASAEGGGSYVDTLSDPALPTFDYTGTEIVIRNSQYIFRTWPISSKSGDRINYTSSLVGLQAYTPIVGNGFFIQNHLSLLTGDGDWMYDETTNTLYMYFADDNPAAHTVHVAVSQHVIDVSNREHVEILGIKCFGSIGHGINRENTSHVNTNGCEVAFCGEDGINNPDFTSSYCSDTFNVVHDCHGTGIYSNYFCHHMVATNNQVYNCGLHAGAAGFHGNSNSRGDGICHQYGEGNKANWNRVNNIGGNGITINGNGFERDDNIVSQCSLLKGDTACLYSSQAGVEIAEVQQYLTVAGSTRRNICIGSAGNMVGIFDPTPLLFCCYMDDLQNKVFIEYNLFANSAGGGLYLHNTDEITVRYNTFYGCSRLLNLSQDGGNTIRNTVFTHNKLYCNSWVQTFLFTFSSPMEIDQFGEFDYNSYLYIENHIGRFGIYNGSDDVYNQYRSFAEWKAACGGEENSTCEAYQQYAPASPTVLATFFDQLFIADGSQVGSGAGQFINNASFTETWETGKAVLTKTAGGKQASYMATGGNFDSAKVYLLTQNVIADSDQYFNALPEHTFEDAAFQNPLHQWHSGTTIQTHRTVWENMKTFTAEKILWMVESGFIHNKWDGIKLEEIEPFDFESDIELIYNSGTAPEEFTFDTNRKNLETDVVALAFTLDPGEFAVLQKTTEPLTPTEGAVIRVFATLTIV